MGGRTPLGKSWTSDSCVIYRCKLQVLVQCIRMFVHQKDSTSNLFHQNRDLNGLKMQFEARLDALTKTDSGERRTMVHHTCSEHVKVASIQHG